MVGDIRLECARRWGGGWGEEAPGVWGHGRGLPGNPPRRATDRPAAGRVELITLDAGAYYAAVARKAGLS